MKRHDPNELLNELSRPKAPAELKQQVLSVAGRSISGVERRNLEERLWTSIGLRYAWAGVVIILMAVNVSLGLPQTSGGAAAGRAVPTNWMESLDLESALDGHRSGGPTVAEARGFYDDYLYDSMVQGDQS